MSIRIGSGLNLTWVAIFILVMCWWIGLLNVWMIVVSLFTYKIIIYFVAVSNDSKTKKEAQEFSRQIILNREHREVEKIYQIIQNSIQTRNAVK
jgi:ABC-type protease/lipase transport system fused ATPase/permease subunit